MPLAACKYLQCMDLQLLNYSPQNSDHFVGSWKDFGALLCSQNSFVWVALSYFFGLFKCWKIHPKQWPNIRWTIRSQKTVNSMHLSFPSTRRCSGGPVLLLSPLPDGYSITHPTIIIHSVKGGGQHEGSWTNSNCWMLQSEKLEYLLGQFSPE
jgi:hypothetical protein